MDTLKLNDAQVASIDMTGAQRVDLSPDQMFEALNDYVNKHGLVTPGVYRGVLIQSEVDLEPASQLGIKRMRIVYLPKR